MSLTKYPGSLSATMTLGAAPETEPVATSRAVLLERAQAGDQSAFERAFERLGVGG